MTRGNTRAAVASSASTFTVVVASADVHVRRRVAEWLGKSRWKVREACGGAEAIGLLEAEPAEALIVDDWLPDLEAGEFVELVRSMFPDVELVAGSGAEVDPSGRSPRRKELLLALQNAHADCDVRSVDLVVESLVGSAEAVRASTFPEEAPLSRRTEASLPQLRHVPPKLSCREANGSRPGLKVPGHPVPPLPDMVGDGPAMRELAWLVRLVAPRTTAVLIEGATGTGKELVAKAVHALSTRAAKPFVTLNCAAIPESLLEAELFGHTRGAFTGAVQSRVGRVEAANGGTLFLDEIGEMPLALQAKMLRFLENGEIQRIGGNESMRVDVRIVAATHQPLKQRASEDTFRLDLYHRLAVFPVRVPSLCDRMEDIPALASMFLGRFGQDMPIKRISQDAQLRLLEYDWPGNIRELAHVLERATILAEDRPEITADEIWL
jgi:DNA-binding NtrC family response regulator